MASTPTLVLLAAGLGTRYGGLKQVDPVGPGGTAILDYTLADAARAGFGRAVLVVRPEIEGAVRRHLEGTGAGGLATAFAHQTLGTGLPSGTAPSEDRRRPWGTAHAVLAAAPGLDGPFAVANADDHYGPDAWSCLGAWLAGIAAGRAAAEATAESEPAATAAPAAAVVGYRLADTLSEHGGVSRAVCSESEGGLLDGVREAVDVRRAPDGAVTGEVVGVRRALDGDARVSMNLWGFGPGVLPVLADAFEAFLAAGPGPEEELHLPDVVGDAVVRGRLRVRMLPCGTEWFGMTHAEDRPEVARRLAERGPPGPPGPPPTSPPAPTPPPASPPTTPH